MGPEKSKPDTLDYASPKLRKKTPIPPEIKRKMIRSVLYAMGFLVVWAVVVFSDYFFGGFNRIIVFKNWAITLWLLCCICAFGFLLDIVRGLFKCNRKPQSLFAFLGLLALTLLLYIATSVNYLGGRAILKQQYTDVDGKTYYVLRCNRPFCGSQDVKATDKESFGFADAYVFFGPYP